MLSIDQNCHSLWDVIPKLRALAGRGSRPCHLIEDIDVAFTSIGADPDGELHLAPECFHHSGGGDWGAAVFYSEFLGRLPVDLRDWEPLTGGKTSVLARQLDRTAEDLYRHFSPGDTWQLVGPSYVGDREHHRVIGDLTVRKTAPFLRELFGKAAADMAERFPGASARARSAEWIAREETLLDELLGRLAGGRLVDLYRAWMKQRLGEAVRLDLTSSFFALGADAGRTKMMELFLADYDKAAALYNQAITDLGRPLRLLNTKAGELPFFATLTHEGHFCRVGVSVHGDCLRLPGRELKLAAGRRLPLDDLRAAGVRSLAGKAMLLVLQARLLPGGGPLAVPYRGSLYMPAATRLAELLDAHDLLPGRLAPVVRVRFGLLDRMAALDTTIRLPDHLQAAFGRDEITAAELAGDWQDAAAAAGARLKALEDTDARTRWQDEHLPDLARQVEQLDARRRRLAETSPKSPEIRQVWKHIKALRRQMLAGLVDHIALDYQVSQIGYWDSRGAIEPWCIALGGERFYNEVIAGAEVCEQPPGRTDQ